MRTGQELPEKIKNAPDLFPGNIFYYLAYIAVSNDRMGMDLGPIRYSAISKYADDHCLDYDERVDLGEIITQVDQQYVKHLQKKNKPKPGSSGDKPSKKAPRRRSRGR